MSEELSNALAGLANQLGISVSQLWDWLQGSGIQAYAWSKIATLATTCGICAGAFVACTAIALSIYKSEAKRTSEIQIQNGRVYDLDFDFDKSVLIIVLLVSAVFSFFVLATTLPDLMGWLISPEGMVMQELFGRL